MCIIKIPVLELKKKKWNKDIIQLDQSHTDNKWVESIIKLQKPGHKIYTLKHHAVLDSLDFNEWLCTSSNVI